jgi:hypothetical protein
MAGGGRRLTGGSHESVRGREKEGTGSGGEALLGHGLAPSLGRNGAPGLFHIFFSFLLFPFLFSYFFYIFCKKKLQFKPNYFHRFCRIHNKVLNQHQTCFQNRNKIFNKRS